MDDAGIQIDEMRVKVDSSDAANEHVGLYRLCS
jgi:hypothetical protein